jgi:hypothetical protein
LADAGVRAHHERRNARIRREQGNATPVEQAVKDTTNRRNVLVAHAKNRGCTTNLGVEEVHLGVAEMS